MKRMSRMRRVRKRRKRWQITDQLGGEDGLVAVGQVFVHAHHHAVRDDRQDDHVPGHQRLAGLSWISEWLVSSKKLLFAVIEMQKYCGIKRLTGKQALLFWPSL